MQITFLHVQGLAVSMFFLSWCWQKGVYLRAWQIFLQVCTNCCYLWHPQKLSLPTPAHASQKNAMIHLEGWGLEITFPNFTEEQPNLSLSARRKTEVNALLGTVSHGKQQTQPWHTQIPGSKPEMASDQLPRQGSHSTVTTSCHDHPKA